MAQDWCWGQSQNSVCLNLPLLSFRENDDTQRLYLPCTSHVHPSHVAPSNVHQNLSEMGVAIPSLPANGCQLDKYLSKQVSIFSPGHTDLTQL